ncbi:hypothetical protein ACLEIY_08965 [Acetobacter tropicalis]|uniref:Uncharacterized protein n=1 Tax=Acetobacter tropicalis NBRC 101654 TaxID=749388 RepID=F7VIV6_9PROT|nr:MULTISPECIES: hypothetical protein [Acetobacter]MCG4253175.1 hypothetical protein [Acetobacter senegalensis]GAA10301.1 hypothetical protein ATPR_3305 [Acetobacter tropicalis NBRC 101654]
MTTAHQANTLQAHADAAAQKTLAHMAERALICAATLAGKAVATYQGLSRTTLGEITNALAFIALGAVLMCCTDAGWWLLGQWADGVTEIVLYLEGVA